MSASQLGGIAESMGLAWLDAARLRDLSVRWEVVGYPDAVARKVVVLQAPPDDPKEVGKVYLSLTDHRDAAAETWGLNQCRRLGIRDVVVSLMGPDDFDGLMAQQEGQMRAMDGFQPQEAEGDDSELAATISMVSIQQEASPVIKLVNSTLYDALKLNASDIHLECDAQGLRVQYRLDGVLVPITEVAGADTAEQVIQRVKVMAELDIAERRVPQDGRFKVRVGDRDIDFRVSVMPSIFGEDAVLRLLDRKALTEQAQSLTLESLGLREQTKSAIRRLAAKPHGMLLVTGPTGSGKTTTLYGTITEIHTGRDKIITIEDPVEYRLPQVLQIPVNEKKGLTFARGLRSILRHDPDKIMVGEIRDDETAQIAVQAALTGHLVFTTVHANNVFDVVGRFLHMGVDAYSFSAALNGIVAQRLVRMNCRVCSEPVKAVAEVLSSLSLDPDAISSWNLRAGKGCSHCRGTGFKGRRAVAEVLVMNDRLRESIAAQASISTVKAEARQAGWTPLLETSLELVATGETTLDEVARVAG
ncbi:GspE/PulE family protein [Variovorax sp. Sphag1AA]|uniref:GspE/PulE family protein n=1 Tax=Variovorax sp. Sphag1AA TaxID=2587027 RepID=UPI001618B82F|nr:GspE/PulE family protein [Variovorax sp. Sphag1AA]MBB3176024.1 general secretion pathway protein E [Variovorax sp. Sphag1AA]